jgi:hypothetical protein
MLTAKFKQDTVLKLGTQQSSELSASELYSVKSGQEISVTFYDAISQDPHIRLTLSSPVKNRTLWFVYNRHVELFSENGTQVFPREEEASDLLLTVLKDSELVHPMTGEKAQIKAGAKLRVQSYLDMNAMADSPLKFTIANDESLIANRNTWLIPESNAQISFDKSQVFPIAKTNYKGIKIKLPDGSEVYTDQPVIKNGNFTWNEVTHGGERIPPDREILNNMIALAAQLQKARVAIGKPLHVTSWYRPPEINKVVGGASQSQHLTGKAADIVCDGLTGKQIAALLPDWVGGRGIYPGNRRHILHLDIGEKRSWGF